MDFDSIIKKNKEKRNAYVGETSKPKATNSLKYFKGLITRILLAVIFVLGSMIFTGISDSNKTLYKNAVLENSLEFTKINNLYQDLFGRVDFLKTSKANTTPVFKNINYKNMESYKNGTKLTVNMNETVNVITSGIVVFIGENDELGNTIIIQGNDGVDIWYSNITDTNITIYDYIESGSIIGSSNSDFIYLTICKDGKYLSYEEYQNLV